MPVAITSALAVVTAVCQAIALRPEALSHALILWLGYAGLSGVICGADVAANCWLRGRRFRQQATYVVAQFVPVVLVGMVVTAALAMQHEVRTMLPGLWTMLYGLGIFASLPYLPRALGWIGGFYLVSGATLFLRGLHGIDLTPWAMGLTFAPGQAAIAWVLHVHLERGR